MQGEGEEELIAMYHFLFQHAHCILTCMNSFFLFLIVLLLAALVLLLVVWYITYKNTLTMKPPMTNFHFDVEFVGELLQFSEVTGLSVEVETIEYRDGGSKEFKPTKLPGQHKFSNITLKRGLIAGNNKFFEWIQQSMGLRPERSDMRIRLLNEFHEPVFIWKIINAFPVRYEGPTLKSTGNEVAIETLEITHEGFVVETS
jgi:phage tail-like protein